MANVKHYSEEEIIEKIQNHEMGWLDYINHYSEEWQDEYVDYCQRNGLETGEKSAEAFIHYKDQQLEEALEKGEA